MIKPCTDIVKAFPALAENMAATNAPGLWPRLRCVFIVKDKRDPTKTERTRVHSRCMPNLWERYFTLDKDYSRSVTRMAMRALLSEMNQIKQPQRALGRMKWLVDDQDFIRASMAAAERYGDGPLFHAIHQHFRAVCEGRG